MAKVFTEQEKQDFIKILNDIDKTITETREKCTENRRRKCKMK